MKNKITSILKWFFFSYIWLAVLMLAIDIITKIVVFNASNGIEGTIVADVIPSFVRIEFVLNESAAFGLVKLGEVANRVVLIIIGLVGSAAMVIFYSLRFKKINSYVKACLMLMTSGAIGNLIDRIFYNFAGNKVIDWIDFYGIWPYHFNIADSCIVVGTIMLMVWLIVEEIIEYRKNKKVKEVSNEKILSKEEQKREDALNNNKDENE